MANRRDSRTLLLQAFQLSILYNGQLAMCFGPSVMPLVDAIDDGWLDHAVDFQAEFQIASVDDVLVTLFGHQFHSVSLMLRMPCNQSSGRTWLGNITFHGWNEAWLQFALHDDGHVNVAALELPIKGHVLLGREVSQVSAILDRLSQRKQSARLGG